MIAALLRWIEEAQHALDTAPRLTPDHIHALLATPDAPGRLRDGVTWYLEEATRELRTEAFEARATEPHDSRAQALRAERRTARVELLLARHAESLQRASATPAGVAATTPRAATKKRATTTKTAKAAERALRARTAPLPTQDAA